MLELYRQTLEEAGCFKLEYPPILQIAMDTVPTNAPEKMKALMVMTELMVFASNLRKPIMWKKNLIPVNTISIILAGSGIGKDSSMQMMRNSLIPAYKKINKYRVDHAKLVAIEDAEADGKKPTDWKKYYSKPRDLFSGIGTLPGQMKHLASLEAGKLGAGYIQVSELGSELQSNKDIAENIVALAVGYDSGYIPAKTVKDDTQQVDPILNLPFSGLLFGSPVNIIFDEAVKAKFKEECSTKLARRFFIVFVDKDPPKMAFSSTEEARAYRRQEEESAFNAVAKLEPWLTSLVDATTQAPLTVEPLVEDLFGDYKDYNEWLSDTMPKQYPMAILHRQHLHWKALKLAGALAILENDTVLTAKHYVAAVNVCEIFAPDMEQFEVELSKEPYELCSDFLQTHAENGYCNMSTHKLRKQGFIKGTGNSKNKLLELVDLIKSYDYHNRYEVTEGYIHYYEEPIDVEYSD